MTCRPHYLVRQCDSENKLGHGIGIQGFMTDLSLFKMAEGMGRTSLDKQPAVNFMRSQPCQLLVWQVQPYSLSYSASK